MMTSLSRWFRGSRTHSPRAAGRKRCRLQLEALEDRCVPATAADWLDPTFGTAGVVTTPALSWSYGNAPSIHVAVRADGKVLATGNVSGDFAVVRYNGDGTLDTSFGGDGIVNTDFNGLFDRADGVAVVDNKTVVVGLATRVAQGSSYTDIALARYNDDGSLDTTFGNGGKVTTSFGNKVNSSASSIAVQTDGKIVVGGRGGSSDVVVRYDSNGSLDTTFGSGGKATFAVGVPTANLAIQSDGKIVAGGTASGMIFGAMRLNDNGTLDTTFSGDGVVTTPITSGSYTSTLSFVYDLAIDGNDNILLAGEAYMGAPPGGTATDVVLVRYDSNGNLDSSFGGDGIVTADFVSLTGFINQVAHGVALQADGKIVAAGFAGQSGGELVRLVHNTVLMRFNTDGSADMDFGNNGRLELQIGPGGSGALALAESDGKLVVAGLSGIVNDDTGPRHLTVSRFIENGPSLDVPTLVVSAPASATAGTPFSFTVTVQDDDGNTITDYTGTVHFFSNNDPQAVLPADYTFTLADQGVHTFSATFKTAGTGQRLIVTVPDGAARALIQVNPGVATHLTISGPASLKAKTAFSITVRAYDAYGNVATGYTGTVHFSSSDSGATLPANYTFTASDAGVHTFSGLKLTKKGTQSITVVQISGPLLDDLDDVLTINVT